MDDVELESLIEAEARERLADVLVVAHAELARLARSLLEMADAVDALATARDPASPDERRAAFRREECPGRF